MKSLGESRVEHEGPRFSAQDATRAPVQYLKPADFSPVRFALQTLLLVTVAIAVAYVAVAWLGQGIGALLGGFAGFCVYLPIFGWLEFKQDKVVTDSANSLVRSNGIATDGFLKIRLMAAQDWLQAEREKDRLEIERVKAECDRLAKRLEPFVEHRERDRYGKYVPSRTKAIRHGTKVAPPIAADRQQLTIEGQTE